MGLQILATCWLPAAVAVGVETVKTQITLPAAAAVLEESKLANWKFLQVTLSSLP
jgi:hypothetical protein